VGGLQVAGFWWKIGHVASDPNKPSEKASNVDERVIIDALLNHTPDHIYFKDLQSRFIFNSLTQVTRFGLSKPEDAVGKTDFDFFSAEHAKHAFEDEQWILQTGQSIVGKEEKETWPDGRVTWVSTSKMPLHDKHGKIIGTFGISRDITARKLAEERAARFADELRARNAQMEADLTMAREMQHAMLPQKYPAIRPATSGNILRFCHRYQPCAAVGGDFFDVLAMSDNKAGVFICDVMGKGVRAALVTAMVRALVEELQPLADNPGRFLSAINRSLVGALRPTQMSIFASAFYLVADIERGELLFANAGHPGPFHVRRDRQVVDVFGRKGDHTGPALGLFEDSEYTSGQRELAARDLVMLYTDGLFEVFGPNDEEYGQDRLGAAVRRRIQLTPDRLFDELLEEIHGFSVSQDLPDDICMVGVEAA
jgi:phosphoserine phosphatase RsbU/P